MGKKIDFREENRKKYKAFYPFFNELTFWIDHYGMEINELRDEYHACAISIMKDEGDATSGNVIYILETITKIQNKGHFRKLLIDFLMDFTDAYEKTQVTKKNKSKK